MSNLEDVQAIKGFFASSVPKNTEAGQVKSDFLNWYGSQSFNMYASDDELATARAKRDAYNRANQDVLSFVPREMTAQDEADIQNLGSVEMKASSTEAERKAAAWDASRGTKKTKLTTEQTKKQFTAPTSSTSPISSLQGKVLPTLKRWANNPPEYVKQWQMILGMDTDGKFAGGTESATKAWQIARGLPGSGVVDAATWQKAIGSTTVPQNGTVNLAQNLGPTNTPGPKQTFQQAVAAIPPTKAEEPLVVTKALDTTQASMFGFWGKLPTWGKAILAGVSALGLTFAMSQNDKKSKKA